MNLTSLNTQQRILAIHRLTALWAFAESGLGGVLHAMKIPFTGLIIGGFAVIVITFIAHLSDREYKNILQALVIVLMVKAAASPHTPFPAYVAVSFQAFLAFGLFSVFRVNLLSILLLSILAMLESAIQKLLILTLFFGNPLWKAADEVVAYIATQFSLVATNGSSWIVAIYLGMYLLGGVLIGLMSYRLIRKFSSQESESQPVLSHNTTVIPSEPKKNQKKKIVIILSIALLISVITFVANDDAAPAIKTLLWTLIVIITWYVILGPLMIRLTRKILQSSQNTYTEQLSETFAFLPVASRFAIAAWTESSNRKMKDRIPAFIYTLINWSLLYQEKNENKLK
jgi:hypothetical protein